MANFKQEHQTVDKSTEVLVGLISTGEGAEPQ